MVGIRIEGARRRCCLESATTDIVPTVLALLLGVASPHQTRITCFAGAGHPALGSGRPCAVRAYTP